MSRYCFLWFDLARLQVFNPTTALQHGQPTKELMQAGVCKAKVFVCILSPGYFQSPWCVAEAQAALESDIPVVPVFSGEEYGQKQILKLMDKSDPLRSYIFQENLMDIHNTQCPEVCIGNLQTIARRFILT